VAYRVIVTAQRNDQQMDLDIPVNITPAVIASLLGWGTAQTVVVPQRNLILGGDDLLEGKIKEGDVIIFEDGIKWQD